MQKIVISGSTKQPENIKKWTEYWQKQTNCEVVKIPEKIPPEELPTRFPFELTNYLEQIQKADILFVANSKKDGVDGYIGSGVFAEIVFAISQNKLYGKNIRIILAEMPAHSCAVFDEISALVNAGLITIFV